MRVSPRTSTSGTRTKPRRSAPPRLWPHILGAWAATIAGVSLVGVGVLWFLGFPTIDRPERIAVSALDAIATRAFAVVAGLSGIALLVIAYHRQRNNDLENLRAQKAAEREDIKLFNDRFTAAYTELGGEHAAVRLGAVHALAHLADDAPNRALRQTCVDVLCAYVRMPYAPEPAHSEETGPQTEEHRARSLEHASLREVRHSILRVVSNRLSDPDSPWQGHSFDFTGAVFDGGHFRRMDFTSGHLNFNEARFESGEVDFRYSRLGRATVSFRRARFNGGTVNFRHVEFAGERNPESEEWTEDPDAVRLRGTHADFARARFDGAEVLFHDARFAETGASFYRAVFASGRVEFSGRGDEEASGTPPFGLLEAVAGGASATVTLPRAWTPPKAGYSPGSSPPLENPPPG
ncbi:pentapeptide repeat-containing protein [Nocardiopsis alborubida]|uniref:Pentapeptide repeat-containing protein n=1 Tax=Nocardiopsis alborubida TaxID=146802 RepID=A0A7X6M935_9ACTN|nr:pentapeptide repeat-containing protein [Nocardiopsis alborubida]NKY96912.1 pentapeptide repeat-containing protein [Nocardiopsis alborubida]